MGIYQDTSQYMQKTKNAIPKIPAYKSITKFLRLCSSLGLLSLLDSSMASRVIHCGHNPPEDHEAYVAQPLQNFSSLADISLCPTQQYQQNLFALV